MNLCECMLKSLQSCPALCDPMDYSPPGSSVHGILQERILEWVATPSSKGSSLFRECTCVSCLLRWQASLYHERCLGSPLDKAVVQSLSHVQLFATPWTVAHQAPISSTNSWSLLKLMPIESVMPSNHLVLCCPLLLLPSIFPSIRIFSNESALPIRWPKYWSFTSPSVLPMNVQG